MLSFNPVVLVQLSAPIKKWFDDVFTYGWAYGSKGDKLNGKRLGLAMSIGDKKENYQPEGSVTFSVDDVLH